MQMPRKDTRTNHQRAIDQHRNPTNHGWRAGSAALKLARQMSAANAHAMLGRTLDFAPRAIAFGCAFGPYGPIDPTA